MERITDDYVFFWGSEFSNWYPCEFEYMGHKFHNSEQAFMWGKANHFNDGVIAEEILNTPNPRLNKALGRRVRNYNEEEWASHRYEVMVAVNFAKYTQNEELSIILLSTRKKTIVEASPEDTIWGIGLHWRDDDCLFQSKWLGQNLLGKALMEVRAVLSDALSNYE